MTKRERALIYFKDLRERKVEDYASVLDTAPKESVVYEAVSAEIEIYDTAIKALEQEPCDDAISRQAAIQATTGMSRNTGTHEEYAQTVLSCLPSVTPNQNNDERIRGS